MKTTTKTLMILAVVLTAFAFSNPVKERKEIKESSITWKGKKILGSHTGNIQMKEGYLEMDGDMLVGGMFVVDMTTITNTDLGEGMKARLEGHLRSDDFFSVENHPTATLTIKDATKNGNTFETNADLTIKGVTHPINFDLEMGEKGARAGLKIDRTKYDIKFRSGSFFDNLGDNAISNNFELDVILKF